MILIERDTATIVGSPSGTAATIKTMLVTNASITSSICKPSFIANEITCEMKTIDAAITPKIVIVFPNRASFSCKGVLSFLSLPNSFAILPNSVESPTAVTIILQCPLVI
ncbi:hypothetical protein SDC9_138727 [bioreactor metagenome]|uniref:Uncharacterized protein n=1 Tax=bioreactor metagenome TaxID=1076179 RepID=A0A645DQK8_9ZZZZ